MDPHLREDLAALGCGTGEDLPYILDCLETILVNLQDTRRASAIAVLRSLAPESGSESLRIGRLLAHHAPPEPSTRTADPYREWLHPDDPRWSTEIERLAGPPPDRTLIAEFSKRLATVFDNRLRQCEPAERRSFLTSHRDLFVRALAGLGDWLLPVPRVMLTEWIAEFEVSRLGDLLREAQRGRRSEHWDAVYRCATTLQQSPATNDQAASSAREALTLVTRFRRWRRSFERLMALIQGQDMNSGVLFSWSPAGAGDTGMALSAMEAEEVLAGLHDWGTVDDEHAWKRHLRDLSASGLAVLDSDPARSSGDTLTLLHRLRAQWPSPFGPLPDTEAWDAAERRQQAALESQFGKYYKDLRDRFETCAESLRELKEHPLGLMFADLAVPGLESLQAELERLRSIETDLSLWWDIGETGVLHDDRLKRLEAEFQGLQEHWGRSPGFARYQSRFAAVREELQRLEQARQQLKEGNGGTALKTLAQCTSPSAEGLIASARRQMVDERIRAAIASGDFSSITETDLGLVGADLRELYARAWSGRRFLDDLRARVLAPPESRLLVDLAGRVLKLSALRPPPGAMLGERDAEAFDALRRELGAGFFHHADALVEDARSAIRNYPLAPEPRLSELEAQLADINNGLRLPGISELDPFAVDRLLATLIPFFTVLGVHRACIDGAWERAVAQLADPAVHDNIESNRRRELEATLRTARLLREHAPDSDWLAAYRELSAVMLVTREDRDRYLDLVRRDVAADQAEEHRAIIEGWFPQETYLAGLLACFADPRLVADIGEPPCPADEPLFKRLLEHLIQSPRNYFAVRRMWNILPEDLRRRNWPGPESPINGVERVVREQTEAIVRQLSQPGAGVVALKLELDGLTATGLVDKQTVGMIDAAAGIERQLHEFERDDPWNPELRAALERTHRDLGRLPLAVLEARGWKAAVEGRIEGIRVWADLDAAWQDFRTRFNTRFMGFHTDPESWRGFAVLLQRWIESLDRALADLDWTLVSPARPSQRWLALVADWSKTPEGVLWTGEQRPPPPDLAGLRAIYREIADQVSAFSVLHARLIDGVSDTLLAQLRDLRPLSRPVDEIRRQLTNPEVAYRLGSAYQRFIAERDS